MRLWQRDRGWTQDRGADQQQDRHGVSGWAAVESGQGGEERGTAQQERLETGQDRAWNAYHQIQEYTTLYTVAQQSTRFHIASYSRTPARLGENPDPPLTQSHAKSSHVEETDKCQGEHQK